MNEYVPDRGDIVYFNFDPQAGREQKGRRPALILSPAFYNEKASLALVCPITSQVKGYPFEVELTGCHIIFGVVLADHVRSLDWRVRKAQFVEKTPAAVLAGVVERIEALLKGGVKRGH